MMQIQVFGLQSLSSLPLVSNCYLHSPISQLLSSNPLPSPMYCTLPHYLLPSPTSPIFIYPFESTQDLPTSFLKTPQTVSLSMTLSALSHTVCPLSLLPVARLRLSLCHTIWRFCKIDVKFMLRLRHCP